MPRPPAVAPDDAAPVERERLAERLLRSLFFWLVIRPVVLVVLGLNVRHRERLPANGPAIVIANHNSHLDTVVLMTLLPARLLHRVRPVAAADYFLVNRFLAWFSQRILHIVPIKRRAADRQPNEDPLAPVSAALARGDVVLLFPEGSRGEPERLARFKSGVAHLSRRHPEVPVVPVFLHGLGKALPKGAILPVPFFCDIFVGEPMPAADDKAAFLAELGRRMADLAAEGTAGGLKPWE